MVDTLGVGGVETWLMEVLRHVRRACPESLQIDILATSGQAGVFDDEAIALGAKVFYLPFRRTHPLAFARGLREILARERYDAIHDHQGYASGWHFLLAGRRLPPNRITHVHSAIHDGDGKARDRRLVTRIGVELVSHYATHVVGTSRQLLADYGFDAVRFAHIVQSPLYCGIDLRRFAVRRSPRRAAVLAELGWPPDALVVLVAGRLDPWPSPSDPRNWKNSAFAVAVACAAAQADPRVRVVFAGERGPAAAAHEGPVVAAGLQNRIRFLGLRQDIEHLMAASGALLFPSRREGLGMVAVEAQAAGLPVLASTGVPAECVVVPDLVQFLDVREGVEAWTKALLQLMRRPRIVRKPNALVAASTFAVEASVANLVRLYNSGWDVHRSDDRASRMRVLHIVDTLGMGGVETWMLELLRRWRQEGDAAPRIDFLATSGSKGLFDDEVRSLGGEIFYVRYNRANTLNFARSFRRILKRGRYHAIHDHQGYTSGWHFLMGLGRLPSVRVAHVHNPMIEIHNLAWSRRLTAEVGKGLIRGLATHIVGTSRQLITEYGLDGPGFRHLPIAALHCGFDPARFNGDAGAAKASVCREMGWPDDAKVILFAGRIDESADMGHYKNHKNSGFGVSVGMACASLDPKVRMLIAGAGSPAVPILQQRIAEAALSDRIRFLGVRQDIERLMLAADALLFPSQGEGLGMVAVEAQAAGLPVLTSTRVPRECMVLPDLVTFLDLSDGIDAWARTLLRLAARKRDVSAANRDVAKSAFSVDHSAAALLRLYREGVLA